MSKDGFANENLIIMALNDKQYKDLNDNLKRFCCDIFDYNLPDDAVFKAKKPEIRNTKTDVIISYNGVEKNISIKKGSGNSVHQESLNEFIAFLTKQQVSQVIIDDLKLFYYGDDTIDDTGIIRYSADICKVKYANEIASINSYLNKGRLFKTLLDRFLFVGIIPNARVVDFVYHGSIDKAVWASREDIIEYFNQKEFHSATVHIASLTYQVWGRNHNRTAKYPDRRYVIQIKWGNLINDLKAIELSGVSDGKK